MCFFHRVSCRGRAMYVARAVLWQHAPKLGQGHSSFIQRAPRDSCPLRALPIYIRVQLASFYGFSLKALLSFQTWKQLQSFVSLLWNEIWLFLGVWEPWKLLSSCHFNCHAMPQGDGESSPLSLPNNQYPSRLHFFSVKIHLFQEALWDWIQQHFLPWPLSLKLTKFISC